MRFSRRQIAVMTLSLGVMTPVVIAVNANAATIDTIPSLTTAIQVDAAAGGAPVVRFTARNTSASSISVLARDLPHARQSGPILTVTRDGKPVPYRGRLNKYATDDITRIAAGGTYTATLDLAADYDMSRPGTYTVALAATPIRTATQATVRTTTGLKGFAKPAATRGASVNGGS